MYRLAKSHLNHSNPCTIPLLNTYYPSLLSKCFNLRHPGTFRSRRGHSTHLSHDKSHVSNSKKESPFDLLLELSRQDNIRCSPGKKLRLLYNVLSRDQNDDLRFSFHVSNILLDIWKSRGTLNKSELSLFDKICHEQSEKIWHVLPTRRSNTQPYEIYYTLFKHDFNRLNQDILSPTTAQFEKKQRLIDHLKPLFKSSINGKLHTFGSCDNGLWSRSSDIDLCLLVPNCDSKRYMLSKLKLIKSCLSNSDIISKMLIISARVPIVKLYDTDGNDLCDISINNAVALLNSEYVKSMCRLDERVVLMGRFIKHWATCRKINNRAEGTMSSYTLILQLFYYLQNRNPPIIPTLKELEIEVDTSDNGDTSADCKVDPDFVLSQKYNYTSDPDEIRAKCQYLNTNTEDVIELIFGFFEFYAREMFAGGLSCSTIDMYRNEITPNDNGVLIVKCPLSKKNVNPFTIRMWQSLYGEFRRASELIKLRQPLATICHESHLSPLELRAQQDEINQQKLLRLFK